MRDSIIWKAAHLVVYHQVEGDYYEFGVFSGRAFINAFKAFEEIYKTATQENMWSSHEDVVERMRRWEKMRFIGFDSFQGLPDPRGIDDQEWGPGKGKFACTKTHFEKNIARNGVNMNKVTTIPGWFDDTLTPDAYRQYGLNKAAVVYIDSDMYESARTCLNFINPLLTDGTIIIFDDWYIYRGNPNMGEQRAFREWREAHPEWTVNQYQKEGPWANSFILNRL